MKNHYYDEEEVVDYLNIPLLELAEIINELYDNRPRDKRTKESKQYIEKYNTLISIYNKRSNFKAYYKL